MSADCVRAYRALSEADRSGAMSLCDELLARADGRSAAKSIIEADLVRLVAQLPG